MESLLAHLTSLSPSSVYWSLVGVLLLCGLGVPIPEDISLISAGYLAHLGVVNVHKVLVACFAAVLAGAVVAFFAIKTWRLRRCRAAEAAVPPPHGPGPGVPPERQAL